MIDQQKNTLFVTRFLTGLFNIKPTLPRTNVTCDPNVMLTFLKMLPPDSEITLKASSRKCATWWRLLSGQRITFIHVRNVPVENSSVKDRLGDLLKSTRPRFQQKELRLQIYSQSLFLEFVPVRFSEEALNDKMRCRDPFFPFYKF